MANISNTLSLILSSIYGEEVRTAIHDALALINDTTSEAAIEAVRLAEQTRDVYTTAKGLADTAISQANSAVSSAQTAASEATNSRKEAEKAKKISEEILNKLKDIGTDEYLLSEFIQLLYEYTQETYDDPLKDSYGNPITDSNGNLIIDSKGDVKEVLNLFVIFLKNWVKEEVLNDQHIVDDAVEKISKATFSVDSSGNLYIETV